MTAYRIHIVKVSLRSWFSFDYKGLGKLSSLRLGKFSILTFSILASIFFGFMRCDLYQLPGEGPNYWADSRPNFWFYLTKKKGFFHHDIASVHTSAIIRGELIKVGYELPPHPPNFLYLAPCDLLLLSNGKVSLVWQKFEWNEFEVITKAYFEDFENAYFPDGFRKLKNNWIKCTTTTLPVY